MGRRNTYTAEIAAEICERLAGGESLREICSAPHMPPESTVRGWVIDDRGGFAAHYTRARDIGVDATADEMRHIADSVDFSGENGNAAVNAARLKIDTRKWLISHIAPKKYGERLALAGDSTSPLQIVVTGLDLGKS